MRQYFHPATRRASVFLGIWALFGAWMCFTLMELPKAGTLALLVAALTTLLASLLLPLSLYRRDKRYNGIEATLPQPVLLKASVSVREENVAREGYLYLTEDRLFLFARDRKPYFCQELTRDTVSSVKVEQDVIMTLSLGNDPLCMLASAECKKIAQIMQEHGWHME